MAETTNERAERLAKLSVKTLFKQASDAELHEERMRCSRAFERLHTRGVGIGHERVLRQLDDGIARLAAYTAAAIDQARHQAITRVDGPAPQTLARVWAAAAAEQQAKQLRELVAARLEPDGEAIFDVDPRDEVHRQRRELDERVALIGNELQRREHQRSADALTADMEKK